MSGRTKPCDHAARTARMSKADEFIDSAHALEELADDVATRANAIVSLYVYGGIAAADVICCARLGVYWHGEDHQAAVRLLSGVAKEPASQLGRLLSIKSKAAYTSQVVSAADLRTAKRAAEQLLDAARHM